jgi:hypothetical protein
MIRLFVSMGICTGYYYKEAIYKVCGDFRRFSQNFRLKRQVMGVLPLSGFILLSGSVPLQLRS